MLTFYDYNTVTVELLSRIISLGNINMSIGNRIISNKSIIHDIINMCNGDVWHLAQSYAMVEKGEYPQFHYSYSASFAKIDTIMRHLSSGYDWVVFPWGIHHDFRMIGIINENRLFKEIDDESLRHEMEIYEIAKYPLSNQIPYHSILSLEDPNHIGELLWSLFELDANPPIIATCNIPSKNLLLGPEDSLCISQYCKVGSINVGEQFVCFLYEPKDIKSFHKVCKLFCGCLELGDEPDFLMAFPGRTDCELMEVIISSICNGTRSTCSYQNDIINELEWLYMVNVGDDQTWIVSRDGFNIRKIEGCDITQEKILLF